MELRATRANGRHFSGSVASARTATTDLTASPLTISRWSMMGETWSVPHSPLRNGNSGPETENVPPVPVHSTNEWEKE